MRIVHVVASNETNHIYRYVQEFTSLVDDSKIIVIDKAITPTIINELNSSDCVFIHSLPNHKATYHKIIHNVKKIKVVFIHQYTVNELYKTFNKSYLHLLLKNCYKVCMYTQAKLVHEEIAKRTNKNKFVYTELVYNFTDSLEHTEHNDDIIFINHTNKSTQLTNQYLKWYNTHHEIINGVYHIYGISKNIPTVNIENLFNNDELVKKEFISYSTFIEDIKKAKLLCDFSEHFTYGILDVINNGTLIVLNHKLLSKYKISTTSILAEFPYLYTDKSDIDELNKCLNTSVIYQYNVDKMLLIFKQIFDSYKTIDDLLKNIK